jgi:SulP family sulfate permease
MPTIGPIPGGLPVPGVPRVAVAELRLLVEAGVALALLGSIDSLLTSVVVDRLTNTRHDSNRELVGRGIGNMASGLIGGLPGAGATMRSVVNINSGGRTNLSGTVHGLVLLAVLLGLGSLAAHIPLSCLAGILIYVGITIIDYRGIRGALTAPRSDTAVMVIVLGLTVFVDLIVAVIAGIALASVLFAKKLSDSLPSDHGPLPDGDLPAGFPEGLKDRVYVYTFKGPLFFGEAKNFSEVVSRLTDYRHVILVFDNEPLIDQTGAYTVEDAVEQLQAKGVGVYLVHPTPEVREKLEKIATRPEVLRAAYYETVGDALAAIPAAEGDKPRG